MRRGYLKKGSPMYRPEAVAHVSARKEKKEKKKRKRERKRNTELTRFDLTKTATQSCQIFLSLSALQVSSLWHVTNSSLLRLAYKSGISFVILWSKHTVPSSLSIGLPSQKSKKFLNISLTFAFWPINTETDDFWTPV